MVIFVIQILATLQLVTSGRVFMNNSINGDSVKIHFFNNVNHNNLPISPLVLFQWQGQDRGFGVSGEGVIFG